MWFHIDCSLALIQRFLTKPGKEPNIPKLFYSGFLDYSFGWDSKILKFILESPEITGFLNYIDRDSKFLNILGWDSRIPKTLIHVELHTVSIDKVNSVIRIVTVAYYCNCLSVAHWKEAEDFIRELFAQHHFVLPSNEI